MEIPHALELIGAALTATDAIETKRTRQQRRLIDGLTPTLMYRRASAKERRTRTSLSIAEELAFTEEAEWLIHRFAAVCAEATGLRVPPTELLLRFLVETWEDSYGLPPTRAAKIGRPVEWRGGRLQRKPLTSEERARVMARRNSDLDTLWWVALDLALRAAAFLLSRGEAAPEATTQGELLRELGGGRLRGQRLAELAEVSELTAAAWLRGRPPSARRLPALVRGLAARSSLEAGVVQRRLFWHLVVRALQDCFHEHGAAETWAQVIEEWRAAVSLAMDVLDESVPTLVGAKGWAAHSPAADVETALGRIAARPGELGSCARGAVGIRRRGLHLQFLER